MIRQTGRPQLLQSVSQLNDCRGFVIAPFDTSGTVPIAMIQGDDIREIPLTDEQAIYSHAGYDAPDEERKEIPAILPQDKESQRWKYFIDFANFHSQISDGVFDKLVLSRQTEERLSGDITGCSAVTLFLRACERYPRMFISLIDVEGVGMWITATPEILLEGSDGRYRTISLAGTMKLEGEQLSFDTPDATGGNDLIRWTDKNIQEQRFVSTYITECLEQYSDNVTEKGPYTARAGQLVHLRSDFDFSIRDTSKLGNILNSLYPTPAVCGLPKDRSKRFIIENEPLPRGYYSGFMGMLDPHGTTSLYVSLRCSRINGRVIALYAGGGILPDSRGEEEWMETEMKMDTIRNLFDVQQ